MTSIEVIGDCTRAKSMRTIRLLIARVVQCAFTSVIAFVPAFAQSTAATSAEMRCSALATTDFGGIPDAPTFVTESQLVSAGDTRFTIASSTASPEVPSITPETYAAVAQESPAYCRVLGYVAPNTGIEMQLPIKNWNGKFLKLGCGGMCGSLWKATECNRAMQRGYACLVSDMGHKSSSHDATWAYNNLQAEFDFGIRSTHVSALAGKAIAERYYGKAPSRSYFMGCSTGGRQGLLLAQKFPYDFDGIVAGAPAIDETASAMVLLWAYQNLRRGGVQVVTREDLELTHRSIVAKCDLNDGIKDGIIGDPRSCDFEPKELQCGAGGGAACLSPDKVAAIQKLYQGPRSSVGDHLYFGFEKGSEASWAAFYLAADGQPSSYFGLWIADMFRYLSFWPDPGPSWQLEDFDWDKDYKRRAVMETLYSVDNPDLRKFKRRGGKLIGYQGWSDPVISPLKYVDYYELVTRAMGGRETTQDFFRLFMLPGVDHCWGGAGADSVDYLGYIEAWVERGEPPRVLIGQHGRPDRVLPQQLRSKPLPASQVLFSRPHYPYPQNALYSGSGDPNNAKSFVPVTPN